MVAEDPPVGIALLFLRPSVWHEGPAVTLDELYVRPERRGQGLGTAMIELAFALARERGAEWFELDTEESDVDARRFYERHGLSNGERPRPLLLQAPLGRLDVAGADARVAALEAGEHGLAPLLRRAVVLLVARCRSRRRRARRSWPPRGRRAGGRRPRRRSAPTCRRSSRPAARTAARSRPACCRRPRAPAGGCARTRARGRRRRRSRRPRARSPRSRPAARGRRRGRGRPRTAGRRRSCRRRGSRTRRGRRRAGRRR